MEVYSETLSPRCGSNNVVHMNSQKLGLHAQDFHNINPVRIPAWMVEGLMKSLYLAKDERASAFFRNVIPRGY